MSAPPSRGWPTMSWDWIAAFKLGASSAGSRAAIAERHALRARLRIERNRIVRRQFVEKRLDFLAASLWRDVVLRLQSGADVSDIKRCFDQLPNARANLTEADILALLH